MADFEYVACPKCHDKFMAGEEFFRLPQAVLSLSLLRQRISGRRCRRRGDPSGG